MSLRVSGMLRVSWIWSDGPVPWACSRAAVMVRAAAASMARVTHRYQEVQWRAWCSSRSGPCRPEILDIPAEPGDRDQGGQRDRLRAVAAVEGALASTAVAADQQVLASGAGVADGDPGPVVPAVSFGAVASGQPLARPS